jgi:hypothetical protein
LAESSVAGEKRPVVVGSKAVAPPDFAMVWRAALLAGIVLGFVGLVDIAFVWYPPHWSNVDWEFGSVSTTFDALPLPTIGIVSMLVAAAANGRRLPMRLMGVAILLLALLWVVFAVVFVLDVPVVVHAVDPQLKATVKRAIVKTGLIASAYIVLYTVLGVWALRRARASAKGAVR